MVSIGKLGAGQAKYYLDQAALPMSGLSAVSSGVEDYYVNGAEAAGRWCGRSAARLGLIGEVDGDDLHRILAGEDPGTGELLRRRGRVPGFDVTFSAPKSVGVVFGVGRAECAPRCSAPTTSRSRRASATWSDTRRSAGAGPMASSVSRAMG